MKLKRGCCGKIARSSAETPPLRNCPWTKPISTAPLASSLYRTWSTEKGPSKKDPEENHGIVLM